jgi:hypothetical protein
MSVREAVMVGVSGRRRLRRVMLVAGVLVCGLVSGSMLGAVALVTAQWAIASDPLFAEPGDVQGSSGPGTAG